jgi:hypothetical protein
LDQEENKLEASLLASKVRYRRHEKIRLKVMLTNSSQQEVYVFGRLEWGPSASFRLHLRDSHGKELPVFADDMTPPVAPEDSGAFVKLLPQHFLGTYLNSPLGFLNLTRPGRYDIFVEYRSPIWKKNVNLRPFWGKEDGTIRSNIVRIEILP